MDTVIYDPLEDFNEKLKVAHFENADKFFENLVQRSGIDISENRETVRLYQTYKENLFNLKKKLGRWRVLRVIMCITVVLIPLVILKTTPKIQAIRTGLAEADKRSEALMQEALLEQRVMVLQNCARLLDKAIELDKGTFENISMFRSGITRDADAVRNELGGKIETMARHINVAAERYPDLQAHREIADAMQQNMYLQREITAARELYNDTINEWNKDIFAWPTKKIVAAKNGYTTRIPFVASKEVKEQAKGIFF